MTDNTIGYIGVFELQWKILKALIRPRGKFKKDKQSDITQKAFFFLFRLSYIILLTKDIG